MMKEIKQITGDYTTKQVFIDEVELLPDRSQGVYNHSPDGFNWGYYGSGPAQLALAILLEVGVDEEVALRIYQDFKQGIIAKIPQSDFVMDGVPICTWINYISHKDAQ